MQYCWVVPDLDEAIIRWVRTAGVGPFFRFENVTFEPGRYRGKPAQMAENSAAIAYAGDVQIELVCPATDEPSIWSEIAPRRATSFHHAALYCDDYQARRDAYTARGFEVAFEGFVVGHRTCWIDTVRHLGFMVELITKNPIADAFYAQMHAAAQAWNGEDPIGRLN